MEKLKLYGFRLNKSQKAKVKKAAKKWNNVDSEAGVIRHLIETYL
jgi:hypothetical protein